MRYREMLPLFGNNPKVWMRLLYAQVVLYYSN
jgi:hypothetical protein